MKFTDVLSLLGGLALFLYGMQMMSGGLEAAAGNRMKQILEKLTANRFLGVAVGADLDPLGGDRLDLFDGLGSELIVLSHHDYLLKRK